MSGEYDLFCILDESDVYSRLHHCSAGRSHPSDPSKLVSLMYFLFWGVSILILLLLLTTAYTTWGIAGRKRHLSAARQNAWAGGMLYRDSVYLTPLVQVFWGRPLALQPLDLVLYAR